MDETDFSSREAYVEARLRHLKHRLRSQGEYVEFSCQHPDPELELAFLEQVMAIEAEPTITYAHQLIGRGIELPPPDEIPDERMYDKIWQVIHGLAGLRVFLSNTGHLNDRDLYTELWSNALNEFTWDMSGCTNGAMHLDLLGSGSEEDTRIWLETFASDQQRREWQEQFPGESLPPQKEPVSDRDVDLPKPDYR